MPSSKVLRAVVSLVTALSFFLETTGLALAAPPDGEVQPVPYSPAQPIPVPAPQGPPDPGGTVVTQAPAYAPVGPGDSVYLRGGGVMRGSLVELLPNDHVTLLLPTGQTARIDWARIEHIERAAAWPPLAPLTGALGPRPPRSRHLEGASVVVHIDADPGVVQEAISPGTGRWALVCAAPCDAPVPFGRQYRIAGDGIRPSRAFGIQAEPGQHVVITVSAGSRGALAGGITLVSVGAVAILVGLSVVLAGALVSCENTDLFTGACEGGSGTGLETAGAIISVAGVAILVGGIVLLASNARTSAVQTLGDLVPQAPPRPETAWLRAPDWHDSLRGEAAGLPRAASVSLFSRSF
jgi:hypothetical protein